MALKPQGGINQITKEEMIKLAAENRKTDDEFSGLSVAKKRLLSLLHISEPT
jgi:hypothetical protein